MSDIEKLMAAMDAVKQVTEAQIRVWEALRIAGEVLQQFNERLEELETRMNKQELGFDPPTDWEEE